MFDENSPLYDVPIETLGLSEDALQELKRVGITSIGDCLDHYARGKNAMMPATSGFLHAMANEVKQKLQQHGYVIPGEPDA
ncbi:MAG: hypothetical protein HZC41_09395 [Chloroflexi bacterium]|nr:hypothetical protein [Chloroflexota bacterium]